MPKTYNALFDQVCNFENLHEAYLKARRCKRYRKEILMFISNMEEELFGLQNALLGGNYKTGEYRKFDIFEPKKREISALPFKDRVVHHALCNIIEPLFEKKFIFDSYACRRGKGTHAGSERLTEFLRAAQRDWEKFYCLKADIAKFFPNVDHEALKMVLRRTIRCRRTLELMDGIIDSVEGGKGIPIGNLTSQLFANIYLNTLDHFIKEDLRVKFYVRYMDDFVLLSYDKGLLQNWRGQIEIFLGEKLRLLLNRKTSVFPAQRGVDFLGYRTWSTHKLLRKRNILGMKRKFKGLMWQFKNRKIGVGRVRQSVASWIGHAKHANSHNVVSRVLAKVVFCRT